MYEHTNVVRYRKRPVTIEAFQWTGDHDQIDDPVWIVKAMREGTVWYDVESKTLRIETLEGEMVASAGDWIIQGVKGELYPCKPDIFELTYEPVLE